MTKTWDAILKEKTEWDKTDRDLFFNYIDGALKETGTRRIGLVRARKYTTLASSLMRTLPHPIVKHLKNTDALKSAVGTIEGSNYEPAYKKDMIKCLGRFYVFYNTKERSLKYASGDIKRIVEYTPHSSERKAAKDTFTREEVRELIKFSDTLDRAIIAVLFETGARISEFSNLKKSNITLTNEGADIFIQQGKTGQRKVLVVEAVKYLTDWMEKHPIKKDDSYLWVSQDTKKRLTNPAIAKRIRVVRAKLNVYRKDNGIPPFKKPINPHNFRHSRASELGTESGMTEAILCSYFGWEIGSDMPRTYLHLDPNKVRRAVLATYGKAKIEDTKIITHKACQRCKEENPIGLSYCGKCGTELNSNKMISNITQMDNKIKDMKNEIDLLKKNMNLPQIYRVFKQKKPKE